MAEILTVAPSAFILPFHRKRLTLSMPKGKRVMFADSHPGANGRERKFLNVILFDKNEEPVACNPNPKERQRVARMHEATLGHDFGGQGKVDSPKNSCQSLNHSIEDVNGRVAQFCGRKPAEKNDEHMEWVSPMIVGRNEGAMEIGMRQNASKLRVSTRPLNKPIGDRGTVNTQGPVSTFVPKKSAVPADPTAGPRNRLGRKVRSLWLLFKPKAEAESENWGPVGLASIYYDEKMSVLSGKVRVDNVQFKKEVFIRYTVDNWSSFRDIAAVYESSPVPEHDIFSFSIPVPINMPHGQKVAFAVRYRVANKVYWDNNDGQNYEGRVVYTMPSPTVNKKSATANKNSTASVPPFAPSQAMRQPRPMERLSIDPPSMKYTPLGRFEYSVGKPPNSFLSPTVEILRDYKMKPMWTAYLPTLNRPVVAGAERT